MVINGCSTFCGHPALSGYRCNGVGVGPLGSRTAGLFHHDGHHGADGRGQRVELQPFEMLGGPLAAEGECGVAVCDVVLWEDFSP